MHEGSWIAVVYISMFMASMRQVKPEPAEPEKKAEAEAPETRPEAEAPAHEDKPSELDDEKAGASA